jgi:putative SOS response-associated peptidase YedK
MRRFVQAFGEMGELPDAWSPALRARMTDAQPDYNIGKGDGAWVLAGIDGVLHVQRMRWGLVPAWSKTPDTRYNTITARLQRAPRSRIFAKAWQSRRCVVPIGGYYKWDRTRKPAVPHFIQEASGRALCVAALWEAWTGEDGTELRSFAMLTHESRAIPPPLTPDGPVFLPPRAARLWLGESTLLGTAALHVASAPTLVSWPVSAAYMDRARNGHTLIEPATASDYLSGATGDSASDAGDADYADEDET